MSLTHPPYPPATIPPSELTYGPGIPATPPPEHVFGLAVTGTSVDVILVLTIAAVFMAGAVLVTLAAVMGGTRHARSARDNSTDDYKKEN